MKEMDRIKVVVEKDKYTAYGVHKGMYGWICDPRSIDGTWLVNFPQCGENEDIATIAVNEEDMEVVPVMHAIINEQIKAEHESLKEAKGEDLSDYIIRC